ncbi:hypothetical protein CRG98_027355 [Punica granatum]|uniref:Reverse transcriptase Ty1/copia-type domain-containing protein n=1 Tax=Punica granatum TaxID=22663 RepID=A0A2I0J7P6_PUNGR|nr:hypothetical protein CRG98_027355 [Punica granatum]
MDSELQKQHENMRAYDMIVHLRQLYQEQARHERFDISKALFQARLTEGSLVGLHVLKMIGYVEALGRLRFPLGQELATDLVLQSLPNSYNNDEPTTYAEAVIGPDSEKWLEAMRSEMEFMYTNQVWTLVDPPEGVKPIEWLKQASRSWNLRFDDAIKEFGFIKNEDEPCVYKKSVKSWLRRCFSMKDLGEATYVLGAVSWKSSKQETVADSTIEAEYFAASNAAKEAVWIKKFVTELVVVPCIANPVDLYCDNNGAIAQAKEPGSHQRSKHILRRFHLIREIIDRGDVKICRIPKDENLADPLMKPLVQCKHEAHTRSIGIRQMPDWL